MLNHLTIINKKPIIDDTKPIRDNMKISIKMGKQSQRYDIMVVAHDFQ